MTLLRFDGERLLGVPVASRLTDARAAELELVSVWHRSSRHRRSVSRCWRARVRGADRLPEGAEDVEVAVLAGELGGERRVVVHRHVPIGGFPGEPCQCVLEMLGGEIPHLLVVVAERVDDLAEPGAAL
jgi:hypothetical protein